MAVSLTTRFVPLTALWLLAWFGYCNQTTPSRDIAAVRKDETLCGSIHVTDCGTCSRATDSNRPNIQNLQTEPREAFSCLIIISDPVFAGCWIVTAGLPWLMSRASARDSTRI